MSSLRAWIIMVTVGHHEWEWGDTILLGVLILLGIIAVPVLAAVAIYAWPVFVGTAAIIVFFLLLHMWMRGG